jgi:hypothetical protein
VSLRRGFFRLWVVVSVLWISGVAATTYYETGIPSATRSCAELLEFTEDKTGRKLGAPDVADCEQVWQQKQLKIAGTALVPPGGALVLGILIGWVWGGFRQRPNAKAL